VEWWNRPAAGRSVSQLGVVGEDRARAEQEVLQAVQERLL